MAIQIQLRRGTDAQNNAFTGATGELVFDATNITVRVHDGLTTGGYMLASLTGTQTLTNKTLVSPSITSSLVTGSSTMNLFNTTATTLNIGGAATTVSIGASTGTLTINNANTVVTGNLTVNGTTTTVNSVTYTVDDPNLELNSVATPTDANANGGGITLKGTTDKTISWSTTGWTSSEDWNLVTGKQYEINGTLVLSATTLGSGVTGSSLTSVGTLTTGVWSATNIALNKGGTNAALTAVNGGITYSTASALAISAAGTAGQALLSAGAAAPVWTTLSLTDLPDAWVKKSVQAATTANITLSAPQTIDGISLVAGDRVLVKDQTTASQNGIYIVAAGAWTRSTDADTISKLSGAVVNVDSGTVNGGIRFDTDLKSTDTLNTTAVNFYKAYDVNDAATANTASKLVLRDASGNFSAGTITAALTGNASTATTLQTARNINGVSFNGSADITVTAANPNALTIGTGLSGTSYTGSAAVTIAIDSTVATLSGTQTLTNKTIAAGSNTISGLTNSNLSGTAGITNANLANSSVTVGSTAISLGASSTTLAGLTSIDATAGATSFFATPTTPALFAAGTAVTIGATTGTTTVRNSLVVTGDLTINGTTTTINSTVTSVDDIEFELGSVAAPTDVTANGGGIRLKGATDKTINWSSIGWTSSEDWNLVTGKVYEINGTSVLSATTLGSGVTGSSLTSVGTVTSGTWSASFGAVSGANLTSLTAGNLTGTIPSAVLGNSTHYIGTTAVALNRASASQALTGITSIDGSAATLTTARAINGVNFNGSAAITVPVNTTQKSDSIAYQIPFVTSVTAGNQDLFTDSAANITYNPSTNTLACAGDITSPNFYSVSDERLKSNIQVSSYGLAEVMKLRSVQYDMDGRHEVGLLAQNVEEHMSEFVTTGADGIKKLDYAKMVSVLVKTVQEQQAQIDELKSKVGV